MLRTYVVVSVPTCCATTISTLLNHLSGSRPRFTEENRPLFAFASYNAGPGNISKSRKEALKRGLNPDKWFNNVEVVVAEKIGIETTTYVRNIYKYYATYKLSMDAEAARRDAMEKLKGSAS